MTKRELGQTTSLKRSTSTVNKLFFLFLALGCLLFTSPAMARRVKGTTPKQDGFRMPGEFEKQKQVWMVWPERTDTYRNGAKPVQQVFVNVATAIAEFEPVTMLVSRAQYTNARARLPEHIRVVEMSNNDCWARDIGPTFLVNDKGDIRACGYAPKGQCLILARAGLALPVVGILGASLQGDGVGSLCHCARGYCCEQHEHGNKSYFEHNLKI